MEQQRNEEECKQESLTAKNTNFIFHVSLLYNLILHNRHWRPWWNRISSCIILGALPFRDRSHLQKLLTNEKVKAIVTMNQPYELKPNLFGTPIDPADWKNLSIPQFFACTNDFTPPTIDRIHGCVEFIHSFLKREECVYVHCKAGRGRSTVVVMAYLVKYCYMTPVEAFKFIKTKRKHVQLSAKQMNVVEQYYRKCGESSPIM